MTRNLRDVSRGELKFPSLDYCADPVEAIKFRMEQGCLTPRDLEPYIGQSGRVSEVLNRKRSLGLRMVKRLHDGLKIPYESLLAGVR